MWKVVLSFKKRLNYVSLEWQSQHRQKRTTNETTNRGEHYIKQ